MTAVFESYWESDDFVPYDRTEFAERTATRRPSADRAFELPPTEIHLRPFQERLLEQIEVARRHGRHRNLLVAATGTGKTVMAAVDYVRLSTSLPRRRLLFVAHRQEILEQSRATFRHALRDPTFGELWVGQHRPQRFEHVFASIQSIRASGLDALDPSHFDVVIVDEFHHAAAPSYRALARSRATHRAARSDGDTGTGRTTRRVAGAFAGVAEDRLEHRTQGLRMRPFGFGYLPRWHQRLTVLQPDGRRAHSTRRSGGCERQQRNFAADVVGRSGGRYLSWRPLRSRPVVTIPTTRRAGARRPSCQPRRRRRWERDRRAPANCRRNRRTRLRAVRTSRAPATSRKSRHRLPATRAGDRQCAADGQSREPSSVRTRPG